MQGVHAGNNDESALNYSQTVIFGVPSYQSDDSFESFFDADGDIIIHGLKLIDPFIVWIEFDFGLNQLTIQSNVP